MTYFRPTSFLKIYRLTLFVVLCGYLSSTVLRASSPPDSITFLNCPAAALVFCDTTDNDTLLWNAAYWNDPVISSNNMADGAVNLSTLVSSTCTGPLSIQYELYLDLDGDDSTETRIRSTLLPGYNRVLAGDNRAFDFRNVPTSEQYGFALETTTDAGITTAFVRWNTASDPGVYVNPQLPYGKHNITWIATDTCGNERVCSYSFVVKDCKAPKVSCVGIANTYITQTGIAYPILTDQIIANKEDNYSPLDQLELGLRRTGLGTGFPTDTAGNPIQVIQFNVCHLGSNPVQLWVRDQAGNTSFCETMVAVVDNAGSSDCFPLPAVGKVATEESEGVEGVQVTVDGDNGTLSKLTDSLGYYSIYGVVRYETDYFTQAKFEDTYTNGVTTYDLVLITRFLLGLDPISSPYKLIAADANRSGTISTFDVVELRKLILGIYTELPNSPSWTFIDKSYDFNDTTNTADPTVISNYFVTEVSYYDGFVAVKIGDLNSSAQVSQLTEADDRSVGTLYMETQDQILAEGMVFDVEFQPSQPPLGYQFTLDYEGLELVEILPGADMTTDNFAVFEDALTTVQMDTEGKFSLRFRSKKAGKLSDFLRMSSRITPSKGYAPTADVLDVAIRFDGKAIQAPIFQLYPNTPNPFSAATVITFELPADSWVQLLVYDALGRLVFEQKADYTKGIQKIQLDARQLGAATGALFYELRTASGVATGKMMRF